jgi:hypothetical protein
LTPKKRPGSKLKQLRQLELQEKRPRQPGLPLKRRSGRRKRKRKRHQRASVGVTLAPKRRHQSRSASARPRKRGRGKRKKKKKKRGIVEEEPPKPPTPPPAPDDPDADLFDLVKENPEDQLLAEPGEDLKTEPNSELSSTLCPWLSDHILDVNRWRSCKQCYPMLRGIVDQFVEEKRAVLLPG